MSRSRVFILYSNGLFAQGVRSLLQHEAGVEVVGMERDDPPAVDAIRRLRPDVVLVDSTALPGGGCETLSWIFQEVPEARVITLDLRGNGIDIYDKQRIVAAGPGDLLRLLRRQERADPGPEVQESVTNQ